MGLIQAYGEVQALKTNMSMECLVLLSLDQCGPIILLSCYKHKNFRPLQWYGNDI